MDKELTPLVPCAEGLAQLHGYFWPQDRLRRSGHEVWLLPSRVHYSAPWNVSQ